VSSELVGYVKFPHVQQVFRLERERQNVKSGKIERETIYGITSAPEQRATPERLLEWARGHWAIENKEHYVRDMTFDEDRSQVRKRKRAWILAAMRNLALNLLRLAGATNIAEATRACAGRVERSLRLIGLPVSA